MYIYVLIFLPIFTFFEKLAKVTYYYYYYYKWLAMQLWERAITTLSVRRPQPRNTNHRMKEEKGKIVGDKKGASS